jgi:hypothetical protein
MEYSLLSNEEKISIINERISNLEKHIFHNEILLLENQSIDLFDEEGLIAINTQNNTYTQQILVLKELKETLQETNANAII